jgi:hypothetical protein
MVLRLGCSEPIPGIYFRFSTLTNQAVFAALRSHSPSLGEGTWSDFEAIIHPHRTSPTRVHNPWANSIQAIPHVAGDFDMPALFLQAAALVGPRALAPQCT